MQIILITGANRGVGLALTTQFLEQGDVHVFATCRAPGKADALNALARQHAERISVIPLDIDDAASVDAAVGRVKAAAGKLDVLINNAGISGDERGRVLGQLSASEVGRVIGTNAVSPLIVTQAFRELLRAGDNPRVVMISSGLGSMQRSAGTSYAYRMSKAAMNMAARVLSQDAAMAGITTVTVNPGWVKTDMGGPEAALEPEESGEALRALINRLTPADGGKFFQYDGSELPW